MACPHDQTLLKAEALVQEGKHTEAEKLFRSILETSPSHPEAQHGLKNLLAMHSLQREPPQDKIDTLLGLYSAGDFESVLTEAKRVSQKFPHSLFLFNICAAAYLGKGEAEKALLAYGEALKIEPEHPEVLNNFGLALKALSRLEEAKNAFTKAFEIKPQYAEAACNLGIVLCELKNYPEAIAAYQKALSLQPHFAEAYNNLGVIHYQLNSFSEALAAYTKALELKPDFAEAHNNLGAVLNEVQRPKEAVAAYKKALALKPNYAEAHFNLGNALYIEGFILEAITEYEEALRIKPDYAEAHAKLLYLLSFVCDWKALSSYTHTLTTLGVSGACCPPFTLLCLEDAPERNQKRSETYVVQRLPRAHTPPFPRPPKKSEQIRIGYFSADFREHVIGRLVACLFELHDRSRFKVFAYAYGSPPDDPIYQQIHKTADVFRNVTELSDQEIASRARDDKIDIAIDLTGHTLNSRSGLFAFRAAPVQISYLGYPGTMGAPFIDYLVADPFVIPPEQRAHYSEKILYLPHNYLVSDNRQKVSHRALKRQDAGLPEKGFVFCCFNSPYKIMPEEFSLWMRLLQKVDGSVLWLQRFNPWAEANLKKEAERHGVDPRRLVFAERASYEEYLTLYLLADLFLDTFNYNANATAKDALWMGLPVLTKAGKGYIARACGSLLSILDLPELITRTPEEYEAKAFHLATDSKELTSLKTKLDQKEITSPLFMTELFTKHLEEAFAMAYQNWWEGKDPHDMEVPSRARSAADTDTSLLSAGSLGGAPQKRNSEPTGLPQNQMDMLVRLYSEGAFEKARSLAEELAHIYPHSSFVFNVLGAAHGSLANFEAALQAYTRALAIDPKFAEAQNNLGVALNHLTRFEEALAAHDKALEINPMYAEAEYNRGLALKALKRFEEALASFSRAATLKTPYPEAYNALGNTYLDLKRYENAIAAYRTCLSLKADTTDALYNLGNLLCYLSRFTEATAAYTQCLEANPSYMAAYYNLGNTFKKLREYEKAIAAYRKALEISPQFADAYNNLGVALYDLARYEEALSAYARALELNPHYAAAYNNQGILFYDLKEYEKAIASYSKAIAVNPDYEEVKAQRLHLLAYICDWPSLKAHTQEREHLGLSEASCPPFTLLSLEDHPQRNLSRARRFYEDRLDVPALAPFARPSKKPEVLRVGYFSPDFRDHVIGQLVARLFEVHDRTRFEIHAFSYGPPVRDLLTERIAKAVFQFHEVRELSDRAITELARRHNIALAIDCAGYTAHSRTTIFAHRAAPIQISYLGYPSTMGAPFIDYLIADPFVIPPEQRPYYSEKLLCLPHHYLVSDDTRQSSHEPLRRSGVGLPEAGFVFCCFNSAYKIMPEEFAIWMRLLKKVKGSVLWLHKSNAWAEKNLSQEAAAHGVDPKRLVFAERRSYANYLSLYSLADLFLDTFHYNANATANDALWMGLPVLSKAGKGYIARACGSLLTALDLPELITTTNEAYEATALSLATTPEKLHALKKTLTRNKTTSPLFKTTLFTRHLEKGYQLAYEKWWEGREPQDIRVPKETNKN